MQVELRCERKEVRTRRLVLRPLREVDHLIYVANPEDIGLKASKPF